MSFEDLTRRIEWEDQTFYIEDKHTLKVIIFDENAGGWCEQIGWQEAMMDGPITDLYRARELAHEQEFVPVEIDTTAAIKNMMAISRSLFVRPLEELDVYAGVKPDSAGQQQLTLY